MSSTDIRQPRQQRRLWPWVLAALLLSLFATVFSFWWPMYRANRVLDSIERKDGFAGPVRVGERWQSLFGPRYHPWFHELEEISYLSPRSSDQELRDICRYTTPVNLSLDLSENSADAIHELRHLNRIKSLRLQTDGNEIPLEWLSAMPQLSDLRLDDQQLTPDGWRSLANSSVEHVQFTRCRIDVESVTGSRIRSLNFIESNLDAELGAALVELPLDELSVHRCQDAIGFWQQLSSHKSLRSLHLHAPVDDAILEQVSRIPGLEVLSLYNYSSPSSLSDSQIETIGTMTDLHEFEIVGYRQVAEGKCWSAIARLPALRSVNFVDCPVGDGALAELAKSPGLTSLEITHTHVTDAGLLELVKLSSLQSLNIGYLSRTSAEAVDRFKTLRPDVEIK